MTSEENDGTMTRSEAEECRKKLMAQRTVFMENTDGYFGMVCAYIRIVLTMKPSLY